MNKISVFDFDGTLYKKDSFIDLCFFIYRIKPLRLLFLLIQIPGLVLFKLRLISAKQFKNLFLLYIFFIPPSKLNKILEKFWSTRNTNDYREALLSKIKQLHEKNVETICISASPEMFLEPISKVLQLKLIATRLKYKNGVYRIQGSNCRGKEKIERLKMEYPLGSNTIMFACSDNSDDKELLSLAEESLIVVKEV